MRKAFDANIPKLKPRLRSAMVVVSDSTHAIEDESTIYSVKQTIPEGDTSAPTNSSEPISALVEFATPVIDRDTQPEVSPEIQKEEVIADPNRQKSIVQNIVQFPATAVRKDDKTESKVDNLNPHIGQEPQTALNDGVSVPKRTETIQTDTTGGQDTLTESLNSFATDIQGGTQDTIPYQSPIISPAAPAPIDNSETRRKRLENIKRKVAEAVRPEVRIESVPEDPALAVDSVLGLVSELEAQLSSSRDLEKTLRAELAEAKAELAHTVNDGREASGRLEQAEAQLNEKRQVLEEMLAEMSALEEERDQAVRMVQILSVKDEGRQQEFNDLGHRFTELQRALDESKAEEERLIDELDEYITENSRLHSLLTEITRERDSLARNTEQLIKERDELAGAKKALEKVHHALSQARARLRN